MAGAPQSYGERRVGRNLPSRACHLRRQRRRRRHQHLGCYSRRRASIGAHPDLLGISLCTARMLASRDMLPRSIGGIGLRCAPSPRDCRSARSLGGCRLHGSTKEVGDRYLPPASNRCFDGTVRPICLNSGRARQRAAGRGEHLPSFKRTKTPPTPTPPHHRRPSAAVLGIKERRRGAPAMLRAWGEGNGERAP
jgi:hypothetical protein